MAKALLLAFTGPKSPELEDEYNEWYDSVHLPDVLAVPGVRSARRFKLADGPRWAIRWTKLSLNQIVKDRANRLLEASMALEQVTFETADHREATRAFKERLKPKFGA